MKKVFPIFFLVIFLLSGIFSSYQTAFAGGLTNACPSEGLVPCGPGKSKTTCGLCDFFTLVKNIIDCVIYGIVPLLAVLLIAIGGFMMIIAYFEGGEGPAMLGKAKKLLSSVVIGLLIIYASWLIVNTFFQVIGVQGWTNLKDGWSVINCN